MKNLDKLERPIEENDYVVYFNHIYQVLALVGPNRDRVRIKLVDPSKTTKSVVKYCGDMCLVDKNDILIWKIKRGY